MSAIKNGSESVWNTYGLCAYPNCREKKIDKDSPVVQWDSVPVSLAQVADVLSPMAKLAVVSNPSKQVERSGYYTFNIELHPECAAEWGMHLINDALESDHTVGRKLRSL